ncbi:PAS domain-containing protein [Bernardetia sp.]|uniref:PAS domain-containing protein n=1 Tax=Bernardetia sp. TaxID=1937974 RepID=UPI0025BD099B|nr:PAS domain-containing protein [Bernardetia sp.]
MNNTIKYAFGGMLFGLFFPLFAWVLDGVFFKQLAFNWAMVVELHKVNPIHFVIDVAPIVLSAVFAVMGYYLDRLIKTYKQKQADYEQYSQDSKVIVRRMRIGSFVVPAIWIVLLLSSYVFLQQFLSSRQHDASVINTAGRQRMLSQKIAKSALYLSITKGEEQMPYLNALDENVREFKEAYQNLTGEESTMDFSNGHTNSEKVKLLYDSIAPEYHGILSGVEQLLEANNLREGNEGKEASLRDAVDRIRRYESRFLPIMQEIVSTYTDEASEKVTTIESVQLSVIMVLILLVIALAFAVKPTISRVESAFIDVEVAAKEIAERNQELQASEEELRQNAASLESSNKYLEKTQKDLAGYVQRVTEAKKMAKLAAYELYPKENKIIHTEHLNFVLNIDEDKKITPNLLESYIHKDDYDKVIEYQQEAIKHKKDNFYRLRLKTEGLKGWHWFQGATHCILNKKGEVAYIVNSLQDITERVNKENQVENLLQEVNARNQELQSSEEELRQNSEQLQLINDNLFVAQREVEERQKLLVRAEELAQIGSIDFIIANNTFSYSKNLSKIYGLDEEEMKDVRTHDKYYNKEFRKEFRNNIKQIIAGKIDHFSIVGYFDNSKEKIQKVLRLEANLIRDVIGKPERVVGVVQDVTQDTRQKEEIESARKQLESLSNNLQGIMYRALIDEDWTMKFISNGVERITGYPASDFIDNKVRSFSSIIHQEDNFIDAEIEQAIKDKQPYKVEYRLVHKNGSVIWVEETGQIVEDEINKVAYIDGVLMDITQRKEVEEIIEQQTQELLDSSKELQLQQQLLSDAERMAKMGSYVWDLQTREIKHSTNLPNIYGLSEDTLIDQIIFDSIIHPEEREEHQRAIAEAMMKGDRQVFTTYRAKPKELSDEHWKHFRTYAIIEYNEQGEPIAIIGTVQDITEEVLQQQTTKELLEYLTENKKSLDESQLLARVVSYDMDIITKKIEWSGSFDNIFKVETGQIPKDTIVFQEWIEQEDVKELNEAWTVAVNEKQEFNAVYRINTPNEKVFYVRERGYPIFDNEGSLITMKGTLQDITPSEVAKKKLERTSKQLEKQNHNLLSSINYAQRIQSAMLGGTQELNAVFEDAFVFFEPKDVVSGDFYWYNQVGTRKIVIVGDCTGHGVPGAFMSLLGTTLLNEAILQKQITTPSKILDFMQAEIRRILKQDTTGNRDGMDMAIVVVDDSVGMMEFAGAKNPLLYVHKKRKKGGAEENMTMIKGDVHPIGGRTAKFIDAQYTNHIIELEDIETFYIYSDGYQDQFGGEEGRKFLSSKFRQLLYDTHEKSMRRQRVALKRNLMDWVGTDYEQTDDICVMGVTV